MNAIDYAAVEASVRTYFQAFGRAAPDSYAATLAGLSSPATADDVAEVIRAELREGADRTASAPRLAKAARGLARTRRHEAATPDCACKDYPDAGETSVGGVEIWIDDGDGSPIYRAIGRCARCGRGAARATAYLPTAERRANGDPGTREMPLLRSSGNRTETK